MEMKLPVSVVLKGLITLDFLVCVVEWNPHGSKSSGLKKRKVRTEMASQVSHFSA